MIDLTLPVGTIEQIDPDTWEIRSDSAPGGVVNVYRDSRGNWLCDCMWFTIHMDHKPPHPECKHIKECKTL